MDWFGGFTADNPSDYAGQAQYQDRNQILGAIKAGLGQQAPMADQSQADYWRRMQQAQAGQLAGIANGSQQGAGELAAQRQIQNALASQQAMARMARGNNAALAARNGARNAAGIGLAGAGMSQQAALTDQQAAQQALMQALGQGRNQDQQMALANQQSQLQQQQLGLGYLGQLGNMDANQLSGQMAAYQTAKNAPGMFGSLLSAGGQVAGAYFTGGASLAGGAGGQGQQQQQAAPWQPPPVTSYGGSGG